MNEFFFDLHVKLLHCYDSGTSENKNSENCPFSIRVDELWTFLNKNFTPECSLRERQPCPYKEGGPAILAMKKYTAFASKRIGGSKTTAKP